MPDPKQFENEKDFLAVCIPKRIEEGDSQEQAVAACMGMWEKKDESTEEKTVEKTAEGNWMKTVSKTDDALRIANYIILFGGRDLEGLGSYRVNPNGTRGEFFSADVELDSTYLKSGQLYVDWEHGRDPDGEGIDEDEVLGYVDWKTAVKDERGWFVERVLNRRSKYVQWLEELIEAGLIGNSTEPVQKGVKKKENGEIVAWPLKRDTLTVNPMEPRMLTGNQLQAMKALHITLSDTPGTVADMADAGKDENEKVTIESEQSLQEKAKMEKDELKAMLDESNKTLLETVKTEAATVAKTAVDEALKALPELQKGVAQIEVTSDPADRPFKSIGANAIAIANYVRKGVPSDRLRGLHALQIAAAKNSGDEKALELAYKAILGSNESIPSQGEFLLEPTLTPMFLQPIHEVGILSSKVRVLPVGPNSNSGWIQGIDETTRATGSRWGGVVGYHSAEAATMTASQPKFRKINWELHKAYVLQYATDELLADSNMLTAIINQSAAEELQFMVNDDIMNGIGGDRPVGVLNSPALVHVHRAATTAISHADLIAMWARVSPRSKAAGQWYINGEVHPQLDAIYFTGTTSVLSPYIGYTEAGVMQIYGRPVIETEFNAALGTQGDILFADLGEYLFWEKGSIEAASSVHIQFLTDQTCFRFITRYDGQTALASAMTPYKGTITQSPFVSLASTTA
jgi:HK97 family phage major capsid protein